MTDENLKGVPYISASDAAAYVAKHVGNRYQARLIIADAMHAGELITTADAVWLVNDIEPTDKWSEITKDAELLAENVELPSDFWMDSGQWPDETRHWRWKEGNFLLNAATAAIDPFHGDALTNVQFDFRQVMEIVGQTSRSGVGGRKINRETWSLFWIDVIKKVGGDKFAWAKFENKRQLKLFLLEGDNEDRFAESNVDVAVEIAWRELVELSCCRFRGHRDKVFLELEDGDATTEVQP